MITTPYSRKPDPAGHRQGPPRPRRGPRVCRVPRSALALVLAVVVVLGGCSRAAGTDGDVTNGWGPLPAASAWVAPVGACLTGSGLVGFGDRGDPAVAPVDCAKPHKLEVVKTGRFADGADVPGWGSDALRAAFDDCGAAATEYVGADWHTGWLFPHVGRPSTAAWKSGARAYTCGLAELVSTRYPAEAVERTGSLKGAAARVAVGCALLVGGLADGQGFYTHITGEQRIDCAAEHDAEFAATIELPAGTYPAAESQDLFVGPRCGRAVAALLGLSEQAMQRRRDVRIYYTWLDDQTQWQAGHRVSTCYAMVAATHKVRASLKGLGTGPLPY
ncbi:septum formation family protein [Dactylosporangium sp. CA-092794]|uniref:septum formation family protein n=1 Tax=Dactylosporangium sp. CA-092794 TaxID=3239929 RepID=UPI003D8ABC5F